MVGDVVEFGFADDLADFKSKYDDSCVYVLEMDNGSTKIGASQKFISRVLSIETETGLHVVQACHSRYMPRQQAFALESRFEDDGHWYKYDGETWHWIFGSERHEIGQAFCDYLKSKGLQSTRVQNNALFKSTLNQYLYKFKSSPEYCVRSSDFNSQPYLLNCKNGVVDLRTGALLPHDPALLLTLKTDVEYRGLNYHSEEVDKFLNYIMPDAKTRTAVLRFLGYSLTGYTTEHVAMCISYSHYLYELIKRTFGWYLLDWYRAYNSRDVLEKLDKDWCCCKDSFIEKRLFQSRDEYFQISTPVIDLFTDDYQNSTDFFEDSARRPCVKLLIFDDNLKFDKKDDAKRFLKVKLRRDAHLEMTAEVCSGFLSALVRAAVDWFKASNGGTTKILKRGV